MSCPIRAQYPGAVVELTGWDRDYARRALRKALRPRVVKTTRASSTHLAPNVVAALGTCCAVLRAPAGKRLADAAGAGAASSRPPPRDLRLAQHGDRQRSGRACPSSWPTRRAGWSTTRAIRYGGSPAMARSTQTSLAIMRRAV